MKDLFTKSKKTVWLRTLSLCSLFADPAARSVDLDDAAENGAVPPKQAANSVDYQANVLTANGKKEETSGTMELVDSRHTEILLGQLKVQMTPYKVPEGWKFVIETRDAARNTIVQSSTLIVTSESKGAHVEARSDRAKGNDVKAFSLSLAPIPKSSNKEPQVGPFPSAG